MPKTILFLTCVGIFLSPLACGTGQSSEQLENQAKPAPTIDDLHDDLLDGHLVIPNRFTLIASAINQGPEFLQRVDDATLKLEAPSEYTVILCFIPGSDGEIFVAARKVLIRIDDDGKRTVEFHDGHSITVTEGEVAHHLTYETWTTNF